MTIEQIIDIKKDFIEYLQKLDLAKNPPEVTKKGLYIFKFRVKGELQDIIVSREFYAYSAKNKAILELELQVEELKKEMAA